jgi:hypothetical protein
LVAVSTGWNVRYGLEYVDPWNENVWVLGKTSDDDECVALSPVNFPNRESAVTTGQRSAAQ